MTNQDYLLVGGAAELERLTLQARMWEPETERMLDQIGLTPGSRCVDLGCGPMGILGPLSRHAGIEGYVVGIDMDAKQLSVARMMVQEHHWDNVEILECDAYNTGLPDHSFDFVHVRFVFAPVGRDDQLLHEMLRLAKPGGILAIQEPDATSWNCFPPRPAWNVLKQAILKAFAQNGGDFNAGQRTYQMLRRAGLENVHIRSAVIALQDSHPYMRLPLQFATSLRQRILDGAILSETELDRAMADCEPIFSDPETVILTFTVNQVWGRKPVET